nr:MAG TPA: hypothetical protein [Caudoviricetes sp.]
MFLATLLLTAGQSRIFFRTIFSKQIKQKIKQIKQLKIYKKNINSRCA